MIVAPRGVRRHRNERDDVCFFCAALFSLSTHCFEPPPFSNHYRHLVEPKALLIVESTHPQTPQIGQRFGSIAVSSQSLSLKGAMPTLCATCENEKAALKRPKTQEPVRENERQREREADSIDERRVGAAAAATADSVLSPPPPIHPQSRNTVKQHLIPPKKTTPSTRADLQGVLLQGPGGRGAPHHRQQPSLLPGGARRGGGVGRQGLYGVGAHADAAQRPARVSEGTRVCMCVVGMCVVCRWEGWGVCVGVLCIVH